MTDNHDNRMRPEPSLANRIILSRLASTLLPIRANPLSREIRFAGWVLGLMAILWILRGTTDLLSWYADAESEALRAIIPIVAFPALFLVGWEILCQARLLLMLGDVQRIREQEGIDLTEKTDQ